MTLLLTTLLFTWYLLCSAKLDNPLESDAEKPQFHRFLRSSGEIQHQILSRNKETNKHPLISITTYGPNVFAARISANVGKRTAASSSINTPLMSLMSSSPLVGRKQTAKIESSFSLEASLPILNNEGPQKTTIDQLDKQEENEVTVEVLVANRFFC